MLSFQIILHLKYFGNRKGTYHGALEQPWATQLSIASCVHGRNLLWRPPESDWLSSRSPLLTLERRQRPILDPRKVTCGEQFHFVLLKSSRPHTLLAAAELSLWPLARQTSRVLWKQIAASKRNRWQGSTQIFDSVACCRVPHSVTPIFLTSSVGSSVCQVNLKCKVQQRGHAAGASVLSGSIPAVTPPGTRTHYQLRAPTLSFSGLRFFPRLLLRRKQAKWRRRVVCICWWHFNIIVNLPLHYG